MQVVKAMSQCPAQATPFAATFRTDVSLEVNVIGTARLVLDTVWAAALNTKVVPRSTDILLLGDRLI
jgi:hypothetical protein